MADNILLWRLLKFIGVGLWTSGLAGAVLCRSQQRRLFSVHVLATIGLFVTWIAGYAMAKSVGVRIGQGWIGVGILASFLTLHEACAIAERPRVLPWNVGALAATYLASIATMVVRTPGMDRNVAVYVVPLLAGVAALVWTGRHRDAHDYQPEVVAPATRSWVVWLARLEGLSLLALFGVYMPMKYIAGVNLDNGQGWFGWVHGMLAITWMQALWSGSRRLGWSWRLTGLGFVASLLPLGTFVFERFIPEISPAESS